MFQDEARFGRMSVPIPCWAPRGMRPVVGLALVREFVYAYAAVSPQDGKLNTLIAARMNTQTMNRFLAHIASSHPREFIILVLDGAPSHRGKELIVPDNHAPRVASAAAIFARTQPRRIALGRPARKGVRQPCLRFNARCDRAPTARHPSDATLAGGDQIANRMELGHKLTLTAKWNKNTYMRARYSDQSGKDVNWQG